MKTKKIVVFGCDNSGKTTLCNDLAYYLRLMGKQAFIEKSLGPNKTVEEQVEFMESRLNDDSKNIIFDRFPIIEEATCGKVLRNKDNFQEWEQVDICNILGKVDYFILCYPGLFSVLEWGEREQMNGIKENILKLINAYNEMAVSLRILGFKVIEYNYKENQFEKIFKEIIE